MILWCRIINDNVSFLQELKKANQDLEAKVIELTSTCTQQKEQLSKLATDESGSEVTIDFFASFFFAFGPNSSPNLFIIMVMFFRSSRR